MADLWNKRGYGWAYSNDGGWLKWNPSIEREGPSWKEIFPPVQILDYEPSLAPWPTTRYSFVMYRGRPEASVIREAEKARKEKIRALSLRLRKRQEKGEIISIEADLSKARDALEKQIRRAEESIVDLMSKISSILKVWVYESEQAAKKARDDSSKASRSFGANPSTNGSESSVETKLTSKEKLRSIRERARNLWTCLAHLVVPEKEAKEVLDQMLSFYTESEAVATSTRQVLMIYGDGVLPQLKSIEKLDQKRVLYEKNLHRLLHGGEVMSAEEVDEMLAEQQNSPGRPVGADVDAEAVAPYIDKAENLTHAYALVLATQSDGVLDEDAVAEYRKKKNKHMRDPVRSAWRKWGYLDLGPQTKEKLPNLKQRVKQYAEEGTFPEPPESS